MPTVLVICPGQRDRLNLADERILERFDLRLFGPAVTPRFDASSFVDQVAAERPVCHGAFGSNDATAHIARILAERLRLPGSSREAFMRCHDKLESRRLQEQAVPEATPRFAEVDPDRDYGPGEAPLPFPFFVKPVAGHLSQLAYAVHDEHELRHALAEARAQLDAITAFDRRLEDRSFRRMIAEELLDGAPGHIRGLHVPGQDDADRRHRRGHAPERDQLPALRVPKRRARPRPRRRWPAWPSG